MTAKMKGNPPIQMKEETHNHLKRKGQEGEEEGEETQCNENAQTSNGVTFQPIPCPEDDKSPIDVFKTSHPTDEELSSDLVPDRSVITPQQPLITTVTLADKERLHNIQKNCNEAHQQQLTELTCVSLSVDKTCNLTSRSSTLELQSDHSNKDSHREPQHRNNDVTKGNDTDIINKECITFSNVFPEQHESLDTMTSDTTSKDGVSKNVISDMTLNNSSYPEENTESLNVDTELSEGKELSYMSEPNIDLLTELLSSYSSPIPQYFYTIVEGLFVCGDSGCSMDSKPDWFDLHRYKKGQEVALKYFFGLQFAQMLSLLVVLNLPDGLTPLIFSGKSNTPFKSFKRYLSTALRVKSWYHEDLWDPQTEAHKNLKMVRTMHQNIRNQMNSADPQELEKKLTLCARSNCACPAVWSPLHDKLRDDFQATCPYPEVAQSKLIELHRNHNFVNQTDMAVTQFGFVGLFILYPSYFGAHSITDEELDGFVFLWRCVGYLLGIENKYNFCNGSLEVVKQRSADLIEHIAIPSLRSVSRDWEHMTRCVTEGISYYVEGVSFEVSLLYLCNILGLHTPRLQASLTLRQRILYYLTWFVFRFILRIPGAQKFLNSTVEMDLKRARTASTTWLRQKEEKKYPFQENEICS